jgi:predicted RNase H-like HicB family nuclease
MEYKVSLNWDDEARVWIAESDDLPGLILESGSLDTLMERVKTATLDLMSADNKGDESVRLLFRMERLAVVA